MLKKKDAVILILLVVLFLLACSSSGISSWATSVFVLQTADLQGGIQEQIPDGYVPESAATDVQKMWDERLLLISLQPCLNDAHLNTIRDIREHLRSGLRTPSPEVQDGNALPQALQNVDCPPPTECPSATCPPPTECPPANCPPCEPGGQVASQTPVTSGAGELQNGCDPSSSTDLAVINKCLNMKEECEQKRREYAVEDQRERQMFRLLQQLQHESYFAKKRPEVEAFMVNHSVAFTDPEKLQQLSDAGPKDDSEEQRQIYSYLGEWVPMVLLYKDLVGEKAEKVIKEAEKLGSDHSALRTYSEELNYKLRECRRNFAQTCRGLVDAQADTFFFPEPQVPPSVLLRPTGEVYDAQQEERAGLISQLTTKEDFYIDKLLLPDRVTFSFIVQYYQHPDSINVLADNLMRCVGGREGGGEVPGISGELLVNVDEDSNATEWIAARRKTQGFLVPVFTENLHELRAYSRLGRYATGEILVFMQDDYAPPNDRPCTWLRDTLTAYKAWPKLGVIGINVAVIDFSRGHPVWSERRWAGITDHFLYKDNRTGLLMQFATVVDMGPMILRAEVFEAIGGHNEALTRPGESAVFNDYELCTRAWMAGYQVAHLHMPDNFQQIGSGGTHGFHKQGFLRGVNQGIIGNFYGRYYGSWIGESYKHVEKANSLLEPIQPLPTT